ncbi:MAG: Xaa-Pro aminopeptidase [Candidatus Eisenbacteria bacterium]|uniref:Xaa-Pro aminopeptidase n=1 Tax=Eiseniibacteriota bacterium TaxID=2212470 RepID=A0A7Y2H393_UNCEI|nr:Xaa-Pro aminopeptidase [Candidatus Eisenbacteria bacterium]
MFADRRRRFMSKMNGGAALLFAAPERTRSNDTDYRYRQDSYFEYLTGFPEPGAAALIQPDHPTHPFVLFVRDRNLEREIWDGRRYGPEGAKTHFGADAAYTIDELDEVVASNLENQEKLYYGLGRYPEKDQQVMGILERVRSKVRSGINAPTSIEDPSEILDELRLIKMPEELEIMRQAASISAEAHRNAMQSIKPGMREYEVEAIIEYTFRRRGAVSPAYSTIAGSGVNATILHYTENTDLCRDGDLFLVDAGAEYRGYAADITRTYPVNGSFSPAQKAIYELVLDAQLKAIDKVRPGVLYNEIHNAAVRALVEGLVKLGLLKGNVDELIENEGYTDYYMHKTGHWLGLDVHDVGRYRQGEAWRPLEPGMVLTVEPGLYFGEHLKDVPDEYKGMGVRIEDDVLVTSSDPEVLTRETPKSIAEIEGVMAGSSAVLI